MRNKDEFRKDIKKIMKSEFYDEEMIIEDAAHSMNLESEPTFTVHQDFTTSNQHETFYFEKKERDSTDGSGSKVLDYFYIGRGAK